MSIRPVICGLVVLGAILTPPRAGADDPATTTVTVAAMDQASDIIRAQGYIEAIDANGDPLPVGVGVLIAPDTILAPWSIMDAAASATIRFRCCDPVPIESIVSSDTGRLLVVARIKETPEGAAPVAIAPAPPRVHDRLHTQALLPLRVQDFLATAPFDDIAIASARPWPLVGVLFTLDGADTEVVLPGTPFLDGEERVAAISVDDAGNHRTLAAPAAGILDALGPAPVPLAEFSRRDRSPRDRSLSESWRAVHRRMSDDLRGAIDAARASTSADEKNASAWYTLGVCLDMTMRPDESLVALQKSVSLDPDFVESRYSCGLVLLKLDRFEPAIDEFDAAIRIDPTYASPHAMRGAALVGLGRSGEAVPEFETATTLEPDEIEHWKNLEIALTDAGRAGELVAMWRRACEANPDLPDPMIDLAIAQLRARAAHDAVATLRSCLDQFDEFEDASRLLCFALAADGDFAEARSILADLEKASPGDAGLGGLRERITWMENAAKGE